MKKLIFFTIILSLPFIVFSAVPSDSKYSTDGTNIFLEDPLNDATDQPNMILCFKIGRRRVGKECRSRWSPYH